MNDRYFKVVIYTPDKELFGYLHRNLIYQNLELFYLSNIGEVEQYVARVKPRVVILYVDHVTVKFRETLNIIQKMSAQKDLWLVLLTSAKLPEHKLQSSLPSKRVFLLKNSNDYQHVAHNLMFIRQIDITITRQNEQNRFDENINHCLKIVYQEKGLSRIFDRLVNYFPKIISMDYWAIFTIDKQMNRIEHFSQFIPPTRRTKTALTNNLERYASHWLREGRAFLSTKNDEPELFAKLRQWGWPVSQIYFMPIHLKQQSIGGLLVGNLNSQQLNAQEIRFLNEVIQFLSKRILEEKLTSSESREVSDFSDQLLANHFDEETIFHYACRKLNEVTNATSTIFWQYNKGFGFLFPKYFYFLEGMKTNEPHEKDMVFMEKEKFLNSLIGQGKMQSIDELLIDEKLDTATQKIFKKLQYRQVLMLPMKINDEVTGALFINKSRPDDRFTVWQIHKAEEIAKRTQKVIEDTQAVKEAELKLKQLSRIFQLGREIKLGLSLYAVLSRITLNLRKTLGWNDVAILLTDDNETNLKTINRIGFNTNIDYGFEFEKTIPLSEFKQWLGHAELISNSWFTNASPQKTGNGTYKSASKAPEWRKEDLIIAPLVTRNAVLGYLLVADPVDRLRPTEEKVIPLEYYANQAAVSVENSVLYEELRDSQERYRSLAETMNLALVTCDTKGTIFYVNPAFEKLLDYTNEELLGKKLTSFFKQDSLAKLKKLKQKLVSKDHEHSDRVENVELEIMSKSETAIPVNAHGFRFYERRKQTGFFFILNDLRVIKRLERMKADFNSMIVHDLRSPMNVIQGFVELIRNQVVGEVSTEQVELLDIVKENVKKVLALVDNFLVASKLEVGKFNIEPKLGEINSLIRRQVENHAVLTKNKNIKIGLDLDPNLPLILFDTLRIDQVLNNLLSNAMKFTPENGHIYVSSSLKNVEEKGQDKLFASISIRDTGVGIPKDKLPNIFEKYEQVEANQNFNIRGTGLGLSICKEIVNLHSGKIWVESKTDAGSTFTFILPIEQSIERLLKSSD